MIIRVRLFTLIASSFPDIEGLIYVINLYFPFLFLPRTRIHGPLHSFTWSLIAGITVVILAYAYSVLLKIPSLKNQEIVFYLFTPFIFHIVPDLLMYPDMPLFWPFNDARNPYTIPSSAIYLYVLGALTLLVYLIYLLRSSLLVKS